MEGVKDLLFEQERSEYSGRYRSSYYYRGMPDADYDLSTSLSRNCKEMAEVLEPLLLESFVKYVSIEEHTIDETVWKTMTFGQHHGLPTRLLDWSHSPLVALHFADTENHWEKLDSRD